MRMRALALARIRYGYRKIQVLLIREGWKVGKKLVYRLYREEGLALRARPKRRRTVSEHSRQKPRAIRPNQVWSLDFVADQLSDGRRFRALTVVDVFTRECLAIEVGQHLKGHDVIRVLQQINEERGAPQVLFCDNGSGFTSQLMDLWAYHNGVKIDHFLVDTAATSILNIKSFAAGETKTVPVTSWSGTADAKAKQVTVGDLSLGERHLHNLVLQLGRPFGDRSFVAIKSTEFWESTCYANSARS
jgi:hypothetical protein